MIILEYFKNQASLETDFLYSDHTNSINSFPRKKYYTPIKKISMKSVVIANADYIRHV